MTAPLPAPEPPPATAPPAAPTTTPAAAPIAPSITISFVLLRGLDCPAACWLHAAIVVCEGGAAGCGAATGAGVLDCAVAAGRAPADVSALCSTSRPDQLATTTPVTTAVTTVSPSPMAVSFQGFQP